MWFWWFMLGCGFITPTALIIGGRMMWKHCPQKINGVYGYRTERSMKNMETWKFAHDHCGRLWWKMGWMTLIPSVGLLVPFFDHSEEAIGIAGVVLLTIQVIVLIASIFSTQHALKKTFWDDGTRRSH